MPLERFYQQLNDQIRDFDMASLLGDPDAIARYLAAFAPPADYRAPEGAVAKDLTVPGPHGEVPIRVYCPTTAGQSNLGLVWAHDGGWGVGSIDDPGSDCFAREIVSRTGATVVTIDYRLVNEAVHYPIPLDDYAAAFTWVRDHAAELGIDRARLALGGGGCAANMAVATALRLRDAGEDGPAALVIPFSLMHLVVPEGTAEQVMKWRATLPSMLSYDAVKVAFIWQSYVGAPVEASIDPYLTPAIADLGGLPPALVITCEYDYLAPDGEHFARLLEAAGVEVTYREEKGVEHAHLNHPWAEGAQRSLDVIAEWLIRTTA
jgi:acetyl esterase/lipase